MSAALRCESATLSESRLRRYFETLSYLPPLTQEQIAKQVDYIVGNGWTPSLEFSDVEFAYVASTHCNRFHDNGSVNYYDNRYWTMWKLPMFGCNDASEPSPLAEACLACIPTCFPTVWMPVCVWPVSVTLLQYALVALLADA